MSYDLVFRGSLAVVGILLIVVRMNYAIKVASTKVSTKKEGNLSTLWILNSLGTTASIVYVLAPDWMNWSTLGMPV